MPSAYAAIAASPGDDTSRLVYADWLEEHNLSERAAFLLVRRAGLEYREAAAVIGISVPAFKMRVSRALERLTASLQPFLEAKE